MRTQLKVVVLFSILTGCAGGPSTEQLAASPRRELSPVEKKALAVTLSQTLKDPAAAQFNTAVKGWTGAMKPTLTQLAEARRRLELEIKEWEQTAQNFEGDSAGSSGLPAGASPCSTA